MMMRYATTQRSALHGGGHHRHMAPGLLLVKPIHTMAEPGARTHPDRRLHQARARREGFRQWPLPPQRRLHDHGNTAAAASHEGLAAAAPAATSGERRWPDHEIAGDVCWRVESVQRRHFGGGLTLHPCTTQAGALRVCFSRYNGCPAGPKTRSPLLSKEDVRRSRKS